MGKYKEGDIVRLKTKTEMDNSTAIRLPNGEYSDGEYSGSDGIYWATSMNHLFGVDICLGSVNAHGGYSAIDPIEKNRGCWTIADWMIAKKIGESAPYSEEPIIINRATNDIPKQIVNVSGVMKEDFQKIFEWLVSVGFNIDVDIVGDTYRIKGEKCERD